MLNWNAEHIRLTVFPAQDLRTPDPNWWRTLVGREPQAKTIQQGMGIQESGQFNDRCTLSLDLRANRIDWLIAPVLPAAPASNAFPTEFPFIDAYARVFTDFRQLLVGWLAEVSSIRRIAIGAVLIAPVADRVTGYRELSPLLPSVRLDPVNSSDFSYSINRHTTSPHACPALRVNRLSHWAVAQLARLQFQLDSTNVGLAQQERGPDVSAVRLQLDINTDAERIDLLPNNQLGLLFDELLNFARDIAARGDLP